MKTVSSIGAFFGSLMAASAFAAEHNLAGEACVLGQEIALSKVSEDYNDISDGSGWSFNYLHQKNDWFRIGGGAFGLSGEAKDTEIGVYGGGMITEAFIPLGPVELAGNVQLGGASVTVTHKDATTDSDAVEAGTFTQGGGWLAAPQLSLGYNFDRIRVYGFARTVQFLAGSKKVEKFSHNNAGIGLAALF